MIQNVSTKYRKLDGAQAGMSHMGSYIGHGGETYGFQSDSGFYPQLNAAISVIVN
jgi:hypothetical protein